MKWLYLVIFLILRKFPNPASAEPLNATIWLYLGLWKSGNLPTLVATYNHNIVFLWAMDKPSAPKNSRAACYHKTVE